MTAPAAQEPHEQRFAAAPIVPVPDGRAYEPPVTWLLGRQLVAGLKWIALYTGFKSKLDPRDWMDPEVFPDEAPGPDGRTPAMCWQEEEGAFWFDYIADAGDGMCAMYSIASLCLSDLWSAQSPDPAGPDVIAFAQNDARFNGAATQRLPRGQFLLVGGDTSYHIADYWTLIERFQTPVTWAHAALQPTQPSARVRRPIFGLPGNHDYYDFLDGFGRQFRRPTSPEGVPNTLGLKPQLDLPGFKRCQNASYAAIAMPYGWWLWAVDCENGRIDLRQQNFFRRLNGGVPPAKLIVATPEPTTVCGRKAKSHDKIPGVFHHLLAHVNGVREPFLANGELENGRCRLDLSGDHHKYERYWGMAGEAATHAPRDGERHNYASIVAGLGGAFLHPSETDIGEVPRNKVYPVPKESRTAVAAQIFRPTFVARDSFVRPLAAALVALAFVGIFGRSVAVSRQDLWALVASWPPRLNVVATAVALIAGVLALRVGRRVIDGRYPTRANDGRSRDIAWVKAWGGAAIVLSVIGIAVGLYFGPASTIEASVAVALAMCVTGVAASGASMYAEWVGRQVRHHGADAARYYYWVVGGLSCLAVAAPMATLFGARAQPAGDLMTDLLAMLVIIVFGGGAVIAGWTAGSELHGRAGSAGIAAIAAFHVIVQLAIPLLVACMTPARGLAAVAIAAIAVLAAAPAARALLRADQRLALLAMFVGLAAVVAALPAYDFVRMLNQPGGASLWSETLAMGLVRMIAACVFAFTIAPVWLGWYLAVALAFNAHNNEAAGAVRIEAFKQIIRFRVDKDSITGYVIAIDRPQQVWQRLTPRLVDVFTVRP